jgi:diguanylate cyclase (GGDEF)-like protein
MESAGNGAGAVPPTAILDDRELWAVPPAAPHRGLTCTCTATVEDVATLLRQRPLEEAVVVVDGERRPVGVVTRDALALVLGRPYGWALFARRPVTRIMARPDLVSAEEPAVALVRRALGRPLAERYVPLIATGRMGELLGQVRVGALLQHVTGELATLAVTDALTGLMNRRGMQQLIASGDRVEAVLLLDLDGFKAVNDHHGHAAGDAALVNAAHVIRGVLGKADRPARLGGDEFVALLPSTTHHDARTLAERLCAAVRLATTLADDCPAVTASVGVAHALGGAPAALLLRDADRAMYRAKAGGGDRAAAA